MLLSQCPACEHQFWLPRVQPRRFAWALLQINAYFCPSCHVPLRLQRWVVWVRSVAIFTAFLCLFVARYATELSGPMRVLAILFPVFAVLFPKKYELLEPRP